jgi:hypothetical protein
MLWNGNECGKNQGNGNLKGSILIAENDRSGTTAECGMFKLFV